MSEFEKLEDLSYLDNLALYYLCNETPPQTLALAFLVGNEKVVGSMLGVLSSKKREYIHKLMAEQKNESPEKKSKATSGLLVIAENLLKRGLIQKQGRFYYGTQKGMKLE
ncbi:MAG: hypothetical protein N3A69_17180 [Leptospiraceae bacterium]|nr:hypothetical protein [Leptospiraceae bacterium]